MSSTVAPFKSEVVALITAGAPTLQVVYGPAGDVTVLGTDVLIVGNVTGSTVSISLADGAGPFQESYDMELTVSCSRPGPDSQVTATAAAFGFRDAVDALFRTATPTTPGVMSAQVTGDFELIEDESSSASSARNAAVRFRIHVEGIA